MRAVAGSMPAAWRAAGIRAVPFFSRAIEGIAVRPRGNQCGNAVARHRVAQLGHERRVLLRRAVVGFDPLRRRAAGSARNCSATALRATSARAAPSGAEAVPLRFDLAFQRFDVVVSEAAAVGGSPQLAQRSGDGRARTINSSDGAGARGRIDALQPGAIDSTCERPGWAGCGGLVFRCACERRIERRAPKRGQAGERHADDAAEPRQVRASRHPRPAALIPP